jgi:hypothetical protein
MIRLTLFRKFWVWIVSAFFAVVFVQVLAKVAIATEAESNSPDLLSSLGIFNIFVYGSIAGLTVATLCILAVWFNEMKSGSVW